MRSSWLVVVGVTSDNQSVADVLAAGQIVVTDGVGPVRLVDPSTGDEISLGTSMA